METILNVEGMTCGHCKAAVESAAKEVSGVTDAAVNLELGNVTVTHDDALNIDEVKQSIEDQGYDVK